MKNLIALLFVLLIVTVGFGFYRGWFSSETNTSDHKTSVNLSVDRGKILKDINTVKKRTGTDGN